MAAAAAVLALAAIPARAPAQGASLRLGTVRVADGLDWPIQLTAPAGDPRLFVVEQRGVVRVWQDGRLLEQPFLDIDDRVVDLAHAADERGLLGLAFDPDYARNGHLFVHYSDRRGNTVVSRFRVSGDPNRADAGSENQVLTLEQPFANHNGGSLEFSPRDGHLYVGLGDGGAANDPGNRAQNLGTWLGKMLRVDVRSLPYRVPPDNPFVRRAGARPEIWALGLRNPYRFGFDRQTGDLWMADVGQGVWEEIDFQPADSRGGENYGWRLMEGPECFRPRDNCGADTLAAPLHAYDQRPDNRCAVTGGFPYRGACIPELAGVYFFADYCSGEIWTLARSASGPPVVRERSEELAPGGGLAIEYVAAFGEDGFGELYVVDRGGERDGEIYRIVRGATGDAAAGAPARGLALTAPEPNPFRDAARFALEVREPGSAQVVVLDLSGRLVAEIFRGAVARGRNDLVWDGRTEGGGPAAAGDYVIRARAGDEWTSRRIAKAAR